MKIKFSFVFLIALAILAAILLFIYPRSTEPLTEPSLQADVKLSPLPPGSSPPALEPAPHTQTAPAPAATSASPSDNPVPVVSSTNQLERLNELRERFRALAAGDSVTGMRA